MVDNPAIRDEDDNQDQGQMSVEDFADGDTSDPVDDVDNQDDDADGPQVDDGDEDTGEDSFTEDDPQ